jgi:hypothetical protein
LYNDTVRWYAAHNDMNFQTASQDAKFQALWKDRSTADKDVRMGALEELGILERDEDGGWRYSKAYLSWLFEES